MMVPLAAAVEVGQVGNTIPVLELLLPLVTVAAGAAGATGVEPAVPEVVVDVVPVPVVGVLGTGMITGGATVTPPLAAVAWVLMAANEAGLDNVGSGFTLLTKVVNEVETLVKEAGATFWLMTLLSWAVVEVINATDAGNAPLFAAASVAIPDTVDNNDPLLDNSKEVSKAENNATLGSVVVILEVGLVKGAGAVSKLTPGGKPKETATVALACATAA